MRWKGGGKGGKGGGLLVIVATLPAAHPIAAACSRLATSQQASLIYIYVAAQPTK